MSKYKNPVCRGSIALGSACMKCERCLENLATIKANNPPMTTNERITESADTSSWVVLNDLMLYRDHCLETDQLQVADMLMQTISHIKKLIAGHKARQSLNGSLEDLQNQIDVMEIGAPESDEWIKGFEDCKQRILCAISWLKPQPEEGLPDNICSLCYHDKSTAVTCNRSDCEYKDTQ